MKKIRALRSLLSEFRTTRPLMFPRTGNCTLKPKVENTGAERTLKPTLNKPKERGLIMATGARYKVKLRRVRSGKNRLQGKKATDHFQKTKACSEKKPEKYERTTGNTW